MKWLTTRLICGRMRFCSRSITNRRRLIGVLVLGHVRDLKDVATQPPLRGLVFGDDDRRQLAEVAHDDRAAGGEPGGEEQRRDRRHRRLVEDHHVERPGDDRVTQVRAGQRGRDEPRVGDDLLLGLGDQLVELLRAGAPLCDGPLELRDLRARGRRVEALDLRADPVNAALQRVELGPQCGAGGNRPRQALLGEYGEPLLQRRTQRPVDVGVDGPQLREFCLELLDRGAGVGRAAGHIAGAGQREQRARLVDLLAPQAQLLVGRCARLLHLGFRAPGFLKAESDRCDALALLSRLGQPAIHARQAAALLGPAQDLLSVGELGLERVASCASLAEPLAL